MKTALSNTKQTEYKAESRPELESWSGFIPQDSKEVNVRRIKVIEQFAKHDTQVNKQGELLSWRKYVGEVLIHLMEHGDSQKIVEGLIKKGYIDLNGFVRIGGAKGLSRQEAVQEYNAIMVKG